MTSDQWRMPSPRNRPSSADRHLEQCLSSDRIVEDSELESIAGAIGENWKDIGKVLKIKPDHLDFLDRQNCSTVKNRNAPFRMLYIWAQKNDQKATVKRLAKAFLKAGETDAVKALRSWQESSAARFSSHFLPKIYQRQLNRGQSPLENVFTE